MQAPIVDLNYLATEYDRDLSRKCIKFTKQVIDNMISEGYAMTPEPLPDLNDDDAIDKFIKEAAITTFHYTSSCRMSPEGEGGVVDNRLKVHGVHGLRVADASVIPRMPSAHPAAIVVMVAEKCSDMVREDNGDFF